MRPELISRAADSVKSRILPQRGLKGHLRREVKSCFDYFDEPRRGGPISELHVNGLTLKKSSTNGYDVEIKEYRWPDKIDTERFTYVDKIKIRGRKVSMQRVSPVAASARQSLPREEAETVIYMIQHATVGYQETVEDRKEKREKVKNLFEKIRDFRGRLVARPFLGTSKK